MQDDKAYGQHQGRTGIISLNRPRALNAMDQDMVDIITPLLTGWAEDPDIDQVLIRSTNARAFCSGGDVRYGYSTAAEGDLEKSEHFFVSSYNMHGHVADFPKPYIAVIDGIAMGGGLGISVNGSVRVVSENARAAMPELAIGYLPDVGMTLAMQRMIGLKGYPSSAVATFIGVSGWRLNAADMLWAGLATHHVRASDIAAFEGAVVETGVDSALATYATDLAEESPMARFADDIEACFSGTEWMDIDRALDAHANREFVEAVRTGMAGASPMSAVASVEVFRANAGAESVRQALGRENAVGRVLRQDHNFAEGVRAVILDKDRAPKFIPATASEVDPEPFRRTLAQAPAPLVM